MKIDTFEDDKNSNIFASYSNNPVIVINPVTTYIELNLLEMRTTSLGTLFNRLC